MSSGSEPLDWALPWRIDRPAGKKPAPGPELDAWLQQRLLYRAGRSLKDTLDRIDPAIARNKPVKALDEEAVMVAILEFLETPSLHGREDQVKWRLPQHMAQAYLAYFVRGFRQYCATHHLRLPRLPLVSEFSLDSGLLTAETFTALNDYRHGVQSLCKHLAELLRPSEQFQDLSPQEIAVLIAASAALFGGLPHRTQWESLISALQYPLRHDGGIIWFLFDSPNKMRWIADPVTEALLRRFWRTGLLPLSVPISLSISRINRLLGFSDKQASSSRQLKAAVEAMHARHFSPDVASVAQGLIENTRLDEEPWLRLISGMREQCPRKKIALSMSKATVSARADSIEKVRLGQLIEKIGAAVNWNPDEIRKAGQGSDGNDGRAKFLAKAKASLKAIELELGKLFERSGRRGADRNSFAYGLKCYADDLIESGGLKRSTLAPATICNYVSIVKNHLTRLHFEDLSLLPTETREEAYRTAIASQMIRGQNSYRTAFEGFERSILRHLDVEDQIDWTAIPGRARPNEMPPVDANLIDPILFRHVFDSLELLAQPSSLIETMRVLLIVLYRFGLRTGEAAELTIGGLVMHPNRQVSIHVKRSTLTTRKSTNALRMVGPINLPDDEYCSLADYRLRREQSTPGRHRELAATYLFSSPGTNGLENVLVAQEMLIDVLRAASGDPNLRARHFRHSFVSRQYLSGRDALGRLNTDTHEIDEWQRAFLCGHAVPDTGIISYTHVNEIAHYSCDRRVVSNEVPLGLLSQLAGNKDRSLERAGLRSVASFSVVDRFLQSLRVNFPIERSCNSMRPRMRYFDFSLAIEDEPTSRQDELLDFESAWDVYRCARIGKESKQAGEHANNIRARVRDLLLTERLALRIRRRPQLSADERIAAFHFWHSLNDDVALQQVLGQAVSWLRANRYRINMPADIARALEYRLIGAGLTGVATTSGTRQMRWIECRTDAGQHSIGWIEVVAFIFCARLNSQF